LCILLLMYKKFLCCAVVMLACFGCSPRVSYSVRTLHVDQWFSGRNLSNAVIAILPLQSAKGPIVVGELESDSMAVTIQNLRPDLRFASYGEFEGGFPPRFDKREIEKFYKALFSEDVLRAKGMDSVWKYAGQPYIMVFSLVDGASIRNMDNSVFKQVSVRCDLWSREGREVVWRSVCKGVSDDGNVDDSQLIAESVRLLTEALPKTMPNYGRESW